MSAYVYDRSTLITEIRLILNELTAVFWLDATLIAYIDEAIRDIAIRSGCIRKIVDAHTTVNSRTVALFDYKCIAVEYNLASLIKIVPLQTDHIKLDGTPIPQYWFEHGGNLGIEPMPPAVYPLTLYNYGSPHALTIDSQVPDLPYAFCHLIIPYVMSCALREDDKYDAAQMLKGVYENELTFLIGSLLPNTPDGMDNLRFK